MSSREEEEEPAAVAVICGRHRPSGKPSSRDEHMELRSWRPSSLASLPAALLFFLNHTPQKTRRMRRSERRISQMMDKGLLFFQHKQSIADTQIQSNLQEIFGESCVMMTHNVLNLVLFSYRHTVRIDKEGEKKLKSHLCFWHRKLQMNGE